MYYVTGLKLTGDYEVSPCNGGGEFPDYVYNPQCLAKAVLSQPSNFPTPLVRYPYTFLETQPPPITDNLHSDSRWLIHDTACGANATNFTVVATKATIVRMIKAAGDASNPYVIDVDVTGDGGTCTDTDSDTIGAMVTIGGKCYQHVHPDEYNVYDFSSWTTKHSGNLEPSSFRSRMPIKPQPQTQTQHQPL